MTTLSIRARAVLLLGMIGLAIYVWLVALTVLVHGQTIITRDRMGRELTHTARNQDGSLVIRDRMGREIGYVRSPARRR